MVFDTEQTEEHKGRGQTPCLLFHATYYGPDVFVYYALTFLIPVGVGVYLARARRGPVAQQG